MTAETRLLTLAELRKLDIELDALAGPGHPASALRAGVTSPDGVAVAGLEGYLFIGNGTNAWERQFLGEIEIPSGWVGAWTSRLAERQAEAARRNLVLEHLVVPEKQVLYADKRWIGAVEAGRRPMANLLPHLTPEMRVWYPTLELRAARALGSAYHRHNSHWTPSGCCAVVSGLASRLGAPVDWQTQRFAYERGPVVQDLTTHFLAPPPEEESGLLLPVGDRFFEQPAQAPGRHTGSGFGVRNRDAPDPRRVVLFGDSYSYGAGLAAALSAIFAQVVCIWGKDLDWTVVDAHGADIVLWECAERFLGAAPTV